MTLFESEKERMMEEEEPSPKKVTSSTSPFVAEDFIVREKKVIEMLSINFIGIFIISL